MGSDAVTAVLTSRAVITVEGDDWRDFLQGLLTQDVSSLEPKEIRFAALLSPQGRLLFDLFVVGTAAGCFIDCAAHHRAALIERLTLYRLRAKAEILTSPVQPVGLLFPVAPPEGWLRDPRLPSLGYRGYAATPPPGATEAEETVFDRLRISLGVPGPADWGSDKTYPIEANFDLLMGIDFQKGCFVGQETTSRMKRRGAIKSRMATIVFDGAPPDHGAELLAGGLRAGEALSGVEGMAMALLRLDRLKGGPLQMSDGRAWAPRLPDWLPAP
ncbi:MAG TPA: folate-binding protein [Caulobacteraceae bacterium]